MTVARSEIVKESERGFYHCISRCVRRAFLCGFDVVTNRSYEHRRAWVRARLRELINIFAIDLLAYAILSNHTHTLLQNRPDIAAAWSDRDVAIRWRTLFPRRRNQDGSPAPVTEAEITELTTNPDLINKYRKRLSSVSWFNRCLNEYIARAANAEDGCKGRFWEGRFKAQRIKGAGAVLACSVYIDLNPIRAGIAKLPEESDFTSIQDRIRELSAALGTTTPEAGPGPRLVSHAEAVDGELTAEAYMQIVEETGRCLKSGKGHIPEQFLPLLERLRVKHSGLVHNSKHQGRIFKRIVGSADSLLQAAVENGRAWYQGLSAAKVVFA